ncbi:Uncharacterised protein [Vibrio cholerae]|nr:Uncharacterised protein [Vibrio cholerae]
MGFPFGDFVNLVFLEIRQRQIFKQNIEVFIFGNLEYEIIAAFTIGTGLTFT